MNTIINIIMENVDKFFDEILSYVEKCVTNITCADLPTEDNIDNSDDGKEGRCSINENIS